MTRKAERPGFAAVEAVSVAALVAEAEEFADRQFGCSPREAMARWRRGDVSDIVPLKALIDMLPPAARRALVG